MAINYSPKVGQILLCDFDGMKAPEMVKRRPVLVIGTKPNGHGLVTVSCLSTTKPETVMDYHLLLDDNHMPRNKFFERGNTWLKGDMIYTISFERLSFVSIGRDNGRRLYFQNRLSRENMKKVYSCVLHGLHIGSIAEHL